MSENELIKIMYEANFTKKQIDKLKIYSDRHRMSLYSTVHENSRRFIRSLFMHILTFFFILLGHSLIKESNGTEFTRALFSLSILGLTYIIFYILAPLPLGYKSRKVIKITQKRHLNY